MSHRNRNPVTLTSFTKQGSLDMYLHEVRSIRESRMLFPESLKAIEQGDEDQGGGIDEDPDALWLKNIGFGNFVSQLESGEGDDSNEIDTKTSVLPKAHAAAIRRRMNTLRSTFRSKQQNGSSSREDVRNVFSSSAPATPQLQTHASHMTRSAEHRQAFHHQHSPTISAAPSPPNSTPIPTRPTILTTSSSHPYPQTVVVDKKHTRSRSHTPTTSPKVSPRGSPTPQYRPQQPSTVENGAQALKSSFSDSGRGSSSTESPGSSHRSPGAETPTYRGDHVLSLGGGARAGNHKHSDSRVTYRARGGSPRDTPPPPLTPQGSVESLVDQEDYKLHFGSPAHSLISSHSSNGIGTTDQLPNFTIAPDSLGITHIANLSSADLEKVRSLALLELTVTFDDHNIPLRPRRPVKPKSYPEGRIFGIPLATLLANDRKRDPSAQIPLVFQEMINCLEDRGITEEGILRIPGSSVRMNAIQQEMDASFNFGTFTFEGRKVTDVASLLKQFLRDLPIPLLTREYLSTVASIADIDDLKEQVRTLNLLVLLLPDLNQRVLKRLLEFCELVTQFSESNKMDLTNVAMVIAPNLFVALPTRQCLDDVNMAAKTSHVVKLLIKYHNLLWTVPGEMLKQVRFLYEADLKSLKQRSVQRALKQMQQQQTEQTTSRKVHEDEHRIIRVKAPLFTRVCMAVHISDGVTAGDIVQKLQRRSRLNRDLVRKRFSNISLESYSSSSSTEESLTSPEGINAGEMFLFEVGGNIGERCLPHPTDVYALYTVNPSAQWVIKPKDCPDLT